jgi:DNA repair exonuclease SbcCD ATPase subunit
MKVRVAIFGGKMKFKKLILENTYSHKKTEFNLDGRGLCLIVGRNGAGKSSLVKSLLFCLYGIGADSVINKTIGSGACVTLLGTTQPMLPGTADSEVNPFGGQPFKIRRYRKHKKHKNNLHFFINDEPVLASTNTELQKKVEKFVGLDYRAFLNVAAFSSEMLQFCSATDVDRKAIFERILQDLDIYNEYYQQAKEEQHAVRIEIDELGHSIDVETRELSVVKKVLEVEKERALTLETARQNKLEELREELSDLELKLATRSKLLDKRLRLQRAVGQLDGWLEEHPFDNQAFFRTQQQFQEADEKITKYFNAENTPLSEVDRCSECNQPITEEHRANEIVRLGELRDVVTSVLIEFEIKKDTRQKVTDKFNELNEKSEGLRYKLTKYDTVQDSIKKIKKEIEEVEEKLDGEEVVKHWTSKTKQLAKKIATYTRQIKKHEETLVYLEEVTIGFSKQGIPNVIVSRALQHLGERANHYLDILTNGAIGIRLSGFSLTKKGSVRNKIGITVVSANEVDDFDSYSGGERQRLNIALLLALRDVAEFNKGVELNCLFLDEVLDLSLDEQGMHDVLFLLQNKKRNVASIFVISPKESLIRNTSSEFDTVLTVTKESGFSKVI